MLIEIIIVIGIEFIIDIVINIFLREGLKWKSFFGDFSSPKKIGSEKPDPSRFLSGSGSRPNII